MAGYEPKNWQCGDTITAESLNHIEQGIANGGGGTEPLIVNSTYDDAIYILDKTWQEIHDAFASGRIVLVRWSKPNTLEAVTELQSFEDSYSVNSRYYCDNANDYPSGGSE